MLTQPDAHGGDCVGRMLFVCLHLHMHVYECTFVYVCKCMYIRVEEHTNKVAELET